MLIGKELLHLMQDEIRDRKRFKKAFAWEYAFLLEKVRNSKVKVLPVFTFTNVKI